MSDIPTLRNTKASSLNNGLLYTPEQRVRRDQSIWTKVQGALAIFQFGVFAISLVLVINCLFDPKWAEWAMWSIVIKTLTLYTIMVTGSIWEKVVFGKYLFAKPFFWEDVVSMGVIALHSVYIVSIFKPILNLHDQMLLILCAYVAYVINAVQFVLKLRRARLQERSAHYKVIDSEGDSQIETKLGVMA